MTARAAEVLKVRSTYHFAYQAAFKHEFAERPLLIRASTLVPEVTNDPLASYALKAVGLIPGATLAANDRQERAQAILDFLDL